MVDQSLVDYLKGKISAGAAASEADDVLKSFELIKQITLHRHHPTKSRKLPLFYLGVCLVFN